MIRTFLRTFLEERDIRNVMPSSSPPVTTSSHSDPETSSKVVPAEDFDALWEEYEHYKSASSQVEESYQKQIQERDNELTSLRSQVTTLTLRKEEAMTRLLKQTQEELTLRDLVTTQANDIETLRAVKKQLQDERDAIEMVHRGEDFRVQRSESERDAAVERAIIAESRADEAEEEILRLRKELSESRKQVEELMQANSDKERLEQQQQQQQQQQQVSTQAAKAASSKKAEDDAVQAMKVIANRIRRIAAACNAPQEEAPSNIVPPTQTPRHEW